MNLNSAQMHRFIENLKLDHPGFDGHGCEKHKNCSEYEEPRFLSLIRPIIDA